jgi:F-type H+-transporting ATPase subunit gamma
VRIALSSSADIEKRIKVFADVEDIVHAMKAYAGVAIRKTEELVPNIREYENNALLAMSDVIVHGPDMPFGRHNGGKRILVAFGSSQGLCGPYNEKIADAISNTIAVEDYLLLIGRRLKSSVDLKGIKYEWCGDSALSISGIKSALHDTVLRIMGIYRDETFYNLTFIFTAVSENRASIFVEQILPPDIERMWLSGQADNRPLTYLDTRTIFLKVLEEFLYISLYRCHIESLRSENWYRMRSMEGASEILKKNLSELGSLQNYVRQEEITEEMLEILGNGMFYST